MSAYEATAEQVDLWMSHRGLAPTEENLLAFANHMLSLIETVGDVL